MSTTSRRAPRLGPADRIAPHLARRGRFAKIDPLESRWSPTWPKLVGALGWVGLLGGALYKAWSATGADDADSGRGGSGPGGPPRTV